MFIYRQIDPDADEQQAMDTVRTEVRNLAARNGRSGAPVTVGMLHRYEPMRDSFAWAAYDETEAETKVNGWLAAAS